MKRYAVSALIILALLLPTRELPAADHEIEDVYYTDYFSTINGVYYDPCGTPPTWWGTLDGLYARHYVMNCTWGNEHINCYQKVDGNWVEISCPF